MNPLSKAQVLTVAAGIFSILLVSCAPTAEEPTAPTVTLSSITIQPNSATLAVGGTQDFNVTARYSDGSTGTIAVTWVSTYPHIASVDSNGTVTGVSAGTATIGASAAGHPSITDTAAVLVFSPVTLDSITLSPATETKKVGETVTFTPTFNYSDQSTGTEPLTWSSSNTSVASVDANGVATALSLGTATITATAQSNPAVSGTAVLTVIAPVTLAVTPGTASILMSGSQAFTATITYSDNTTGTESVTWTSSNPAVATVNSAGTATPVGMGTTTITAAAVSNPSISGTASLTVVTLVSIAVTPDPLTILLSANQTFTATATYSDNTTASIPVTWSSSSTNVATVDAAGLATPVSTGTTTITATAVSNPNISGSSTLTVITLVSIAVTPSTASILLTGSQTFATVATYSDSSTGTETVTWSSSNTNVATVSASGTATPVATGTTTITATAVSNTSISGSATLTVRAFNRLFVGNDSGGIWTVPSTGGPGTLFLSASNFVGTPHGIQMSQNGQNLYVSTQQGVGSSTTARNLYSVSLSNSTVNLVASNAVTHGMSMDSAGNLIAIDIGVAPNRIMYVNTTTWTMNDFCFGASMPLDTTVFGNDVIVSCINGVYRSPQGGTLTQVFTVPGVGGFSFFTSVDDDSNGNIFTIEWMGYQMYKLVDLNNDGDFQDIGESTVYISSPNVPYPAELAIHSNNDMYVADRDWGTNPSTGIWLVRDLNNDGDAMDSGEAVQFSPITFQGCSFGGGELTFD
ncbi:MAG: Ig-like domain-containing protein [Planctomycetota bacterium]